MNFLKRLLRRLRYALQVLGTLEQRFDEVKINQGFILSRLNSTLTSKTLKDYAFKVFSQWGEDGIIQHLTQTLEIKNKTFIEFGVEDFYESNCRFLMMKDDWRGFVLDGSQAHVERLRKSYFYWRHQLNSQAAFITRENINELLAQSGFEEDLGLLSIDLDGNDFHVLQAITFFRPRILICEYNAVFGATRKVTVPYQPDFVRTQAHYSNLYYGASLAALTWLNEQRGYALLGTNVCGGNAFYVRRDLLRDTLEVLTPEAAFSQPNVRESRDEQGKLTYLDAEQRLALLKGLPVLNVETGQLETL